MFDFEPSTRIALCALVWAAVLVVALRSLSTRSYPTTGLTFAFFGAYTSIHIGALVYLTDGYDPSLDPYLASFGHTPTTVAMGFEASTVGMLCALLGCTLADKIGGFGRISPVSSLPPLSVLRGGAWILLVVGLFGLILENFFQGLTASLAGFQALISSSRNLFVIGGMLMSWEEALAGRERNASMLALFFMLIVPLIVLARTAILADSIFVALAAFSFFLSIRARIRERTFLPNLALFAGLAVAGFFFSAVYLEVRDEVRDILSSGGSIVDAANSLSKGGRVDTQSLSVSAMDKTLYAIDSRLNQNLFVGLAMQKLDALPDTYEEGSTIVLALFGWVPRVLWPGKPERGGAAMITKHTGKQTDGTTSFGTGLVFEFYVNYGYIGVVIGFLVVGYLLRIIDWNTNKEMLSGHVTLFAMYELIGYALIQPGVDLFFIVAGMGSAVIFAALVSQLIAYFTSLRPSEITARAPRGFGRSAISAQGQTAGAAQEPSKN